MKPVQRKFLGTLLLSSIVGPLAACSSDASRPDLDSGGGDAQASNDVRFGSTESATAETSDETTESMPRPGSDLPTRPQGFFDAPHAEWHPREDEENEWVYGLWELPYPGFDEFGRVAAPCDEDSTLLERCFGLCSMPTVVTFPDFYPCNECYEAFDYYLARHHWTYDVGEAGSVCGTSYLKCRCTGSPDGHMHFGCLELDRPPQYVPKEFWPHLYMEGADHYWDSEVDACWFRLPGPSTRWAPDGGARWPRPFFRYLLDDRYFPALERALAMEAEAESTSGSASQGEDETDHEMGDGDSETTDSDPASAEENGE